MATRQILRTIVGSRMGLATNGALVINKNDGSQIIVDTTTILSEADYLAVQAFVSGYVGIPFTYGSDGSDVTTQFLAACVVANAAGVPILLPPWAITISQTAVINKMIGTPGKSKIILAPDFTKSGFNNQFCIITSSFQQAYNDTTASEVLFSGFDIETTPNTSRSIIGLANVKKGLIERVNIRANQVINGGTGKPYAVDALIDLYTCVKNVTIRRCLLENITGAWGTNRISQGGGGGMWIRNIRGAFGTAADNVTEGNVVENCVFRHNTSDEALAIYGVRGPTRNNIVRNNRFYGLDSTDAYHPTMVSCFPLDDSSGAGLGSTAAVYDNLFESNYMEGRSFLYNVFRIGNTADASRLCYNNRSLGNTIIAYRSNDASTGPRAIWVNAGSPGTDPDPGSKASRCIEGTQGVAYLGTFSGNESVDDILIADGASQTNAAFSGFQKVTNATTRITANSSFFTGMETCRQVVGGSIEVFGRAYYNCNLVEGGNVKINGTGGIYSVHEIDSFSADRYLTKGVVFQSGARFFTIGSLNTAASTVVVEGCVGSMGSAVAAIVNAINSNGIVRAQNNIVTGSLTSAASGAGATFRTGNRWGTVTDEAAGTSTQSGTGAQTAFTIAHGLGVTPARFSAQAGSAAASGAFAVTADATNITVTFAVAPANAVNNVVLNWSAGVF